MDAKAQPDNPGMPLDVEPGRLEPMAGDVALLVPVENWWRVLDLGDDAGSRVHGIAPWTRETVWVQRATRSEHQEGTGAARTGTAGRISVVEADHPLPFRRGSFDLVVMQSSAPWTLGEIRPLVRSGGWVVWIVDDLPSIRPSGRDLADWLHNIWSLPSRAFPRNGLPSRWQETLARHHLTFRRAYVHVKDYVWGYLPFDAPHIQRHYLDTLLEEGTGLARTRARAARCLARAGLYRYLASTFVVVARAGVLVDCEEDGGGDRVNPRGMAE